MEYFITSMPYDIAIYCNIAIEHVHTVLDALLLQYTITENIEDGCLHPGHVCVYVYGMAFICIWSGLCIWHTGILNTRSSTRCTRVAHVYVLEYR